MHRLTSHLHGFYKVYTLPRKNNSIIMFEITELKAKKLVELHEIAKELNVPKFKSLKKLDLIYQILDLQAARPTGGKAPKEKKEDAPKTSHSKESNSRQKRPRKGNNNETPKNQSQEADKNKSVKEHSEQKNQRNNNNNNNNNINNNNNNNNNNNSNLLMIPNLGVIPPYFY